ncbi:MAG: thioredoxin domain-containing protein [Thermus sp.]|uniref:DsbA family protein n=1 Tax=Thermus sp. TaxID=275 RepID=UPI00351ADC06
MRGLVSLALALGLAMAQIARPVEGFSQTLGAPPPGGKVAVETKNGRLLAASYEGPEDPAFVGLLLEKATGLPFSLPFQKWYRQNAPLLRGRALTLTLEDAFWLELSFAEPFRARVAPRAVEEAALGPERHLLGTAGPILRVFSDFQCPFCQRLAREVLPELKAQALRGALRVSYRHFPLKEIHPEALPAAIASECAAEQGAFWPYHDRLMTGRLGNYRALARELGLKEEAFARCLEDPAVKGLVEGERTLALRLGLWGTPTAFAGPYWVPNPFDLPRVLDYLELAR